MTVCAFWFKRCTHRSPCHDGLLDVLHSGQPVIVLGLVLDQRLRGVAPAVNLDVAGGDMAVSRHVLEALFGH